MQSERRCWAREQLAFTRKHRGFCSRRTEGAEWLVVEADPRVQSGHCEREPFTRAKPWSIGLHLKAVCPGHPVTPAAGGPHQFPPLLTRRVNIIAPARWMARLVRLRGCDCGQEKPSAPFRGVNIRLQTRRASPSLSIHHQCNTNGAYKLPHKS